MAAQHSAAAQVQRRAVKRLVDLLSLVIVAPVVLALLIWYAASIAASYVRDALE